MNDVHSIVIKKICWENSLRWKKNSTVRCQRWSFNGNIQEISLFCPFSVLKNRNI